MAPHWTLKQFHLVALAHETGSYAAAGARAGLSPPAVTAQMKQLEEEIGLPLFERLGGRLQPTAAGREILDAAARIELTLGECARALAAIRRPDAGSIVVGVVSTAKYYAPMALGAFRRTHPDIELKLVVGNRSDIIAGLIGLTLDLAIMGRPPAELDADTMVIGDHPHIMIAPPDHPLAAERGLSPARLSGEAFLVREVGSGTRGLMSRLFEEAGVPHPRIAMEIGSNETVKQAVMAGLGLAFISAHTVAAEIADGRLAMLDVAGLPVVRQWLAVRNRDKRLMPATRSLQDFLAREGGRFMPKLSLSSEESPN